jgi:RNA 2',3'-cyclic 3'-phosphodiesterase
MAENIRAFVALRMNAEAEDEIAAFIDELRLIPSGIRWVSRRNLHLTLRFLGDRVEPEVIARMHDELRAVAAYAAPITIEARGTGAFPSLARPRVIWIGLSGAGLPELAQHVEEASVRSGLEPEGRLYSPHLTIGRVRNNKGWKQVHRVLVNASERPFGASQVDEMILYRSVRGSAGADYQELGRFSLSCS